MNLKKVLLEINAMEADGIVDRYAIGGGPLARPSTLNRLPPWTWTFLSHSRHSLGAS